MQLRVATTRRTRPQESGTCGISTHRETRASYSLFPISLTILAATDESFAHDGMSPQRTSDSSRMGSFGFWRMTGIGWVGAMLYRRLQSDSSEEQSKYSSTSCFLLDSR